MGAVGWQCDIWETAAAAPDESVHERRRVGSSGGDCQHAIGAPDEGLFCMGGSASRVDKTRGDGQEGGESASEDGGAG